MDAFAVSRIELDPVHPFRDSQSNTREGASQVQELFDAEQDSCHP